MKFRIALAIHPNGQWCASGWGRELGRPAVSDTEKMDSATDALLPGEQRYFIEVEVPVPCQPPTISGAAVLLRKCHDS
jgi:hypothetical protein